MAPSQMGSGDGAAEPLFFSDDDADAFDGHTKKSKLNNKAGEPEVQKQDDEDAFNRHTKKAKLNNKAGVPEVQKQDDETNKKRKKKTQEFPSLNSRQYFTNFVADAQAKTGNATELPPPEFGIQSGKKNDALALLAKSIAERDPVKKAEDIEGLVAYSRLYQARTIRPSGSGWKMKGMNCILKHYQMTGSAEAIRFEERASHPHGGFLCDQMGLGKTLMILAVVKNDLKQAKAAKRPTTLVVLPNSLVSQWISEIKTHFPEEELSWVKYSSISKIESSNAMTFMQGADIVVATYGEVTRSFPRRPPRSKISSEEKNAELTKPAGLLHQIEFRRIILDEGQNIRNPTSAISEACRALVGRNRWILSGTPLINSSDDFWAFFDFLRIEGKAGMYRKALAKRKSDKEYERLHNLLDKIMIRRVHKDTMFGRPLLKLPGITESVEKLDLNPFERFCYEVVRGGFIRRMNSMAVGGELKGNCGLVFVMMLKLRVCSSHPLLIRQEIRFLLSEEERDGEERLRQAATAMGPQYEEWVSAILPRDRVFASLGGSSKCVECHTTMPRADLSEVECGHLFCFTCIARNILGSWTDPTSKDDKEEMPEQCYKRCPNCKRKNLFTVKDYKKQLSPSRPDAISNHVLTGPLYWLGHSETIVLSTKMKAARDQLRRWLVADPNVKIILFCGFLGCIQVFGQVCDNEGWGYRTYDGRSNQKAKDKTIKDFQNDPNVKVLLSTLKTGGVGLNLVMACRLIIFDRWWNEASESQAAARVYRIGQVKPVEIVKYITRDSIEVRMQQIQTRKQKDIDSALRYEESGLNLDQMLWLMGAKLMKDADGIEQVVDAMGFNGEETEISEEDEVGSNDLDGHSEENVGSDFDQDKEDPFAWQYTSRRPQDLEFGDTGFDPEDDRPQLISLKQKPGTKQEPILLDSDDDVKDGNQSSSTDVKGLHSNYVGTEQRHGGHKELEIKQEHPDHDDVDIPFLPTVRAGNANTPANSVYIKQEPEDMIQYLPTSVTRNKSAVVSNQNDAIEETIEEDLEFEPADYEIIREDLDGPLIIPQARVSMPPEFLVKSDTDLFTRPTLKRRRSLDTLDEVLDDDVWSDGCFERFWAKSDLDSSDEADDAMDDEDEADDGQKENDSDDAMHNEDDEMDDDQKEHKLNDGTDNDRKDHVSDDKMNADTNHDEMGNDQKILASVEVIEDVTNKDDTNDDKKEHIPNVETDEAKKEHDSDIEMPYNNDNTTNDDHDMNGDGMNEQDIKSEILQSGLTMDEIMMNI